VAAEQREVAKRTAAARSAAAVAPVIRAAALLDRPGSAGRPGFQQPVPGGITSGFGMRFHPVLRVWKLHDGTDFAAPCGSPIRSPHAGLVRAAYFNAGYGNRLMIDHGIVDGHRVTTGFNHATRYVVNVGQQVAQGQVIGYVGSTGFSTGCHLHLMLWLDGALANPTTFF
jgi:murein DD-endopeptidase MepM/ murein hydrolase activator NlpD